MSADPTQHEASFEHEIIARLEAQRILALPDVREQVKQFKFFGVVASPDTVSELMARKDVLEWARRADVRTEIARLDTHAESS